MRVAMVPNRAGTPRALLQSEAVLVSTHRCAKNYSRGCSMHRLWFRTRRFETRDRPEQDIAHVTTYFVRRTPRMNADGLG